MDIIGGSIFFLYIGFSLTLLAKNCFVIELNWWSNLISFIKPNKGAFKNYGASETRFLIVNVFVNAL